MARIHHNQLWLTASQAANFAGRDRATIYRWATNGLVRVRISPSKKKRGAWQYYSPDIEEIVGIK